MIKLNVFFKLMQKDDKKEILKFEIKGNENESAESKLFELSGSIVVFSITDCAGEEITAEFVSMQRDSKKTVMKFNVKGDSEEKAQRLYKFAGCNVELSVVPSQMTIDEFYEEDYEGLQYIVNQDGTIDTNQNQMTIDEVAIATEHEDELPSLGADDQLPF